MPRTIAGYEIVKELGAGAFGTVWLAEGEVPRRGGSGGRRRRQVAIKQLHSSGDDKAKVALQREFELMQRVRHRSLVRVFEFLPEHDAVVMEAVTGATLDEVMRIVDEHGERIPVDAVLDLGMELTDCLYQAYSTPGADGSPLQLVHRDLKPENVMLTPAGEVKVLDFGLARARRPGQKRDRGVLGTPLYMAPEQALGQHVDHRTDLFAVGLILFEALMGYSAYDIDESFEDPEAEVLERIEAGDLRESLREFRRAFPDESDVVSRCLRADRRARPADGHEVMVDLQALHANARGVALERFCEHFFAHLLPPPSSEAEPSRRTDRRAEPSSPTKRADTMSNDKPPRPGGPPRPKPGPPRPGSGRPRPSGPPGGPPRSSGPPPSSADAEGGPPRPPAGGPPRPGAGGPPRPGAGGPPRPGAAPRPPGPSGPPGPPGRRGPPSPPRRGPIGPAADASPPGPSGPPQSESARDRLSSSGARTPDEDGMLEMVRLIDEDDDDEGDAPKSATAFFKIPKSARKKSGGSAGPRAGGRKPGAVGPPPPGGPPPMQGPGGSGGPPPIAGPGGGGGMISGPVAGGPMAISGPTAGGAAPFGGVTEPEPDPEIGRNRTRSFVTIAIILAMVLFLLGSLTLAGAGIAYYVMTMEPEDEVAEDAEPTQDEPTEDYDVDTGVEVVDVEPAEAPKQRRRRSSAPASTPSKPAASKPAAPSGGQITVKLVSGDVTSVQAVCKGYTRRARFRGGVATFKEVPTGVSCSLNLSSLGGPVAKFSDARAGNTYSCTIKNPETADCK